MICIPCFQMVALLLTQRHNGTKVVTTIPTIGFNVESIQYRNISFNIWDIGGQDKLRQLWQHYYDNTHGIIFVVDSSDYERISIAREELHKLLNEDQLRDAALLVYANKQDLPNSMNASEMAEKLGLSGTIGFCKHPWYIQPACATTKEGIYEGLDWLSKTIK